MEEEEYQQWGLEATLCKTVEEDDDCSLWKCRPVTKGFVKYLVKTYREQENWDWSLGIIRLLILNGLAFGKPMIMKNLIFHAKNEKEKASSTCTSTSWSGLQQMEFSWRSVSSPMSCRHQDSYPVLFSIMPVKNRLWGKSPWGKLSCKRLQSSIQGWQPDSKIR